MNRCQFIATAALSLAFLLVPHIGQAQIGGEPLGGLSIEFSPRSPKPNDRVTATVSNFATDMKRAEISWLIDGILLERGIGQRTFSFTVGDIGDVQTLQVLVKTLDIGTFEKTLTLRPADTDLVWQAKTYTPPFYRGKALNTTSARIMITALPAFERNGTRINPDNLVYEWKHNFNELPDQSGFGKRQLDIVSAGVFGSDTVILDVSTLDGEMRARRALILSPQEPVLAFYREDPLSGTQYRQSIGSQFTLSDPELIIRAVPYFFSQNEVVRKSLQYLWSINGKLTETDPVTPNIITLRQEGGAGTARLTLSTRDINIPLLERTFSTLIKFGI